MNRLLLSLGDRCLLPFRNSTVLLVTSLNNGRWMTKPTQHTSVPLPVIFRGSHSETSCNSPYPHHVPGKGELVYIGSMTGMVRGVKGFSLATSFLGILAQPYLYTKAVGLPAVLKMALGGMMGFYVFVTPVVLHWVTKRFVVNMYYDEPNRTFTALTYTFFLRKKEWKFTAEEVIRPEIPGPFTVFKVQGHPMFLDPSLFMKKSAYVVLMGYDKPIEWKLEPEDVESKQKREIE